MLAVVLLDAADDLDVGTGLQLAGGVLANRLQQAIAALTLLIVNPDQ